MLKRASIILLVLTACAASYQAGRSSHQNVNDLIRVGFLVVSPPDEPGRTDDVSAEYNLIALTADDAGLLVTRFDEWP